jgi:membrane protease YdiL (CAAX protease family)
MNETARLSDASDAFAASLRGFGPGGIAAMALILLTGNIILPNMFVVPIGAMLVLAWTSLSRTPWRDIGYVRPRSWIVAVSIAIPSGIALKVVMKAVVMPLLGADPINHAYHFLAGNRALLPNAIWAMCIAGFAEETLFRGYLFERLEKLLGSSATAKAAIVLITSVGFAAGHYATQGLAGVEQAAVTGLVFGTIFAVTRSIFLLMCAHAAFDLAALAIIYLDLESAAAHLIFK